MLSSIHPLGERARNNSWALTTFAFTLGSVVTATAIGSLLGLAGSALPFDTTTRLVVVAVAASVAGILDLSGRRSPGPRRQVDERWIGTYRGWVYGAAFGAQLGTGVATFVVTWGVWATFVAELMSGSMFAGAIIGAVFGLGRSVGLIATMRIDRPTRLSAFHGTMQRLATPVHRLAGTATVLVALAVIAGLSLGGG